jgi:hypothetical protein
MATAALAADDPSVIWSAQAGPQIALIACPVEEVFFGGARGGGKTDGVLGDFLEHADAYGKDAIGIMFRRQRTELIETIERSRQIYTPLGLAVSRTGQDVAGAERGAAAVRLSGARRRC